MGRLPDNIKLDVSRTFESQRDTVNNHIILMVKKTINKATFPVVDGIIRHIIHERHRHQREDFLNKDKGDEWNNKEKRRKHATSRRTEVRKRIVLLVSTFY